MYASEYSVNKQGCAPFFVVSTARWIVMLISTLLTTGLMTITRGTRLQRTSTAPHPRADLGQLKRHAGTAIKKGYRSITKPLYFSPFL